MEALVGIFRIIPIPIRLTRLLIHFRKTLVTRRIKVEAMAAVQA
jgi:hypothetical protein